MKILEIRPHKFRNLIEETVPFDRGLNAIVGSNGAGKTNLLDAVYFLGTGRSFRRALSKDIIKWGAQECSVSGTVEDKNSSLYKLYVGISDGKRRAGINGQDFKSITDYIGKLVCISFAPTDLNIVFGYPKIRRDFFDRFIISVHPELASIWGNYHKSIRNKKILLAKITHRTKNGRDAIQLWNRQIAKYGRIIMEKRREYFTLLETIANKLHGEFVGEGTLKLKAREQIIGIEDSLTDKAIEDFLYERIDEEMFKGRVMYGPHLDDIEIIYNSRNTRHSASQGQARSIILALKLAMISVFRDKREVMPVVLIDDINTELDKKRRDVYFKLLDQMVLSEGGQIILTTTALDNISLSKARINVIHMNNGQATFEPERLASP